MRIAILYSGLLRTLPETINNNLNYFNGCDIDLYFSLWDRVGYADQINAPDNIRGKRLLMEGRIDEEIVRKIIPPTVEINRLKIEPHKECQFDLINGLDHNGLAGQYYKNWDCFELLNDEIEYDIIVKMRCDLLLNNQINVQDLAELTKEKIVFASKIWYDYSWHTGLTNLNDMLWIGNKEIMRKACRTYHNVDKINVLIKKREQMHLNYGEGICYLNLEAEEMSDRIHTFDFDYQVVR